MEKIASSMRRQTMRGTGVVSSKSTETPEVLGRDRCDPRRATCMPVTVVLDRLRSAYNVGNVFRVCEALRVERIVTAGYTATPPHAKLSKTARGCDALVPCFHRDTALQAVTDLRAEGYAVYAVETVADAACVWDVKLAFPAAFVLGNEALGISSEVLEQCSDFIRLPMFGKKNSINVGNAAAVVLYEAARQAEALKQN